MKLGFFYFTFNEKRLWTTAMIIFTVSSQNPWQYELTEEARDFVHQVNEYLPNNFPAEDIYANLLGFINIYLTPSFVTWSIIARKKLDPGNKLPKPLLPPLIPVNKERKTWVAGIAYGNRQTNCDELQLGETVVLRRELFNQYDIYAVAVENKLGAKLE